MRTIRIDNERNDDWMKTLPGYKTELEIHKKLSKKDKKTNKVKLTAKKQYRKVVAKQGNSRYLIDVGNDKGVIVDTKTGETFQPFNIHSILARGYWNEYEGEDDSKILGML